MRVLVLEFRRVGLCDERMRVLLVAAPHRDTFGYSMPPPGLLRLGGELLRAEVDVELLDLAHELAAGVIPHDETLAEAACERILTRGEFDAVGLSVMGATLPIALLILERLKLARKSTATWLGGPGTTGIDVRLIERFPHVDAIARGEGERTILEWIAALSRGSDFSGIAGTTWRARDGTVHREIDRPPIEDMASLPPYAWQLLPSIADYKRVTGGADGLVAIDSGRGCVYDCSFCTIGRFWSRRSRTLPATRLVDEVLALIDVPAAKSAYLCHDLFGANRGQAIAFCDGLIERGSPMPFEVRARADHLDLALLERMRAAGGYRVLIGVESADAGVREKSHKGLRRGTDMLHVVDDCARAGITPILSLILGLPGEDEAELEASLDLCARACLRAGVNISLHLVNPEPGSSFGEQFARRSRSIAGIPPDMAVGAGETAAERALIDAHPDLFSTFALLPGDEEHLKELHRIATELPEILMRYPRTFALLREQRDSTQSSAYGLYRAWKSSARSFESYVARVGSVAARDMMNWEQALVRAASRGVLAPADGRVRVTSEVVRSSFDLPAIADGLRAGLVAAREPSETWLAIAPRRADSPMSAVTTSRITSDVAKLLSALDEERSRDDWERSSPGLGPALDRFRSLGLVDFASASHSMEIVNT